MKYAEETEMELLKLKKAEHNLKAKHYLKAKMNKTLAKSNKHMLK